MVYGVVIGLGLLPGSLGLFADAVTVAAIRSYRLAVLVGECDPEEGLGNGSEGNFGSGDPLDGRVAGTCSPAGAYAGQLEAWGNADPLGSNATRVALEHRVPSRERRRGLTSLAGDDLPTHCRRQVDCPDRTATQQVVREPEGTRHPNHLGRSSGYRADPGIRDQDSEQC